MMKSNSKDRAYSLPITTVLRSEYPDWQLDFIRSSFYLPLEVLRDSRFAIAPIRVITGDQYSILAKLSAAGDCATIGLTNDGASKRMLENAKQVGISERTIAATKETILVAKIWYGRSGNKEFV